jgi:hypothetical protein
VKVIVHRAQIALMMSPLGEVGRAAERAAGRVRDRAKKGASADTGLMRNSIVSELAVQTSTSVTWRIGSNVRYTIWQELGTGPIYPRRAPMLTFKVGGRWVSVYSTKGVPAQKFLTRAIESVTVEDFR